MATGILNIKGRIWWIVALVVLCLVPFVLPRFYVYLLSIILLFGLFAMSNNFPLGFGGIYQLHHAVFYGVGAYGTALVITKSGLSSWIAFIVGPLIARRTALFTARPGGGKLSSRTDRRISGRCRPSSGGESGCGADCRRYTGAKKMVQRRS